MNIGFDIDGVLNNLPEIIGEYGCRHCRETRTRDCTGCNALNLTLGTTKDRFDFTDEEDLSFWSKNHLEMITKVSTSAFNPEACVTAMQMRGHSIFYITNRQSDVIQETVDWLDANNFPHAPVYYTKDKVDTCKQLKINVMIEDNPHNIMALAEAGIKVVVIEWPYNQSLKHKNLLKRTTSVWEAIRFIQTIEPTTLDR